MDTTLAALVRERARSRCEYCRLPEAFLAIPFEIDHILAQKHGGPTREENLALACFYCNSYKGPNIAGVDPASERIVRLAAATGETEWREIAHRFDHERIFRPLAEGRDELKGLHVNTTIPRIIGAARRYELTSEPRPTSVASYRPTTRS